MFYVENFFARPSLEVTPMNSNSSSQSSTFSTGTVVILMIGVLMLYIAYGFLYSSVMSSPTVIVSSEINKPPATAFKATDIPQPFEGGDYSFNTWVYINNFRDGINFRKPIFELRGQSTSNAFSTLYVGVGAQTNTLVVRTHSVSAGSVQGASSTTSGSPGSTPAPAGGATGAAAATTTTGGSLFLSNNGNYPSNFLTGTDGTATGSNSPGSSEPICDLPTVDLQRWVMVTVILSGRTIDVYMDGKLTRSCVTSSYYKVDPAGVIPVVLGGPVTPGALNGYVTGMSVARFALTPGEIYRMYSNGPKANQTFMSWLMTLVTGNQPM